MSKQDNSVFAYKAVLVTLITSISITGISLLDNAIWNIIMAIVGVVAYAIVGVLYSIHAIHGKNAGKEAYAAVFIILIFIGYCVYQGIVKFQLWVLSWPLVAKILVPIVMGLLIVLFTILLIRNKVKREF